MGEWLRHGVLGEGRHRGGSSGGSVGRASFEAEDGAPHSPGADGEEAPLGDQSGVPLHLRPPGEAGPEGCGGRARPEADVDAEQRPWAQSLAVPEAGAARARQRAPKASAGGAGAARCRGEAGPGLPETVPEGEREGEGDGGVLVL